MKRLGFVVFILTMFVNNARSESCQDTTNIYIDNLVKYTNLANQVANRLSIKISNLNSGKIRIADQVRKDSIDLAKIFLDIQNVTNSLNQKLAEPYRNDFDINFKTLQTQDDLMNRKVADLISDPNEPVYAVQIDYTVSSITGFLSSLTNFRQYLLSLKTVKADDIFDKIKKELGNTDNNVNKKTGELKEDIGKIDEKADQIINLLTPKAIGMNFAVLSVYAQAVFAIGYSTSIGAVTEGSRNYIGAEIVIPLDKSYAASPGGFILYGVQYNKLLLQAGPGYFKTTQTSENLSWKFGALYTPNRLGLGLGYSPVTKIGVQISYKW